MIWQIVFTPRAKKDLQALQPNDRQQIYRALQRLAEEQPNLDIKKLWAEPPQWRLRVGKWRVIYTKNEMPDSSGKKVPALVILNVFDRKEGY